MSSSSRRLARGLEELPVPDQWSSSASEKQRKEPTPDSSRWVITHRRSARPCERSAGPSGSDCSCQGDGRLRSTGATGAGRCPPSLSPPRAPTAHGDLLLAKTALSWLVLWSLRWIPQNRRANLRGERQPNLPGMSGGPLEGDLQHKSPATCLGLGVREGPAEGWSSNV